MSKANVETKSTTIKKLNSIHKKKKRKKEKNHLQTMGLNVYIEEKTYTNNAV
jgi:hypothetical protein